MPLPRLLVFSYLDIYLGIYCSVLSSQSWKLSKALRVPESALILSPGWLWELWGSETETGHTLILEPAGKWDRTFLCSHFVEVSDGFPSFWARSGLYCEQEDSNFPSFCLLSSPLFQ